MRNYKIKLITLISLICYNTGVSQNIQVDVNLNIKHSVDGVSDFGRERHMTVHSTPTENDWIGEEDKLDYLINDLDVYFGRDNGSASWKFNDTPEDPNRSNMADIAEMQNRADYLKNIYDGNTLAHQYQNKGAMIMGTNPHPTYPTLSWYDNGPTWHGWQPYNVETSAEWMVEYLDRYFKVSPVESGEPLPTYWEVINEPDMPMMTGQFMATSQEKLWEYHNLVADGIRDRMGVNAPKIGGMTWGLHDLFMPDGINRFAEDYLDQYLTAESMSIYHAMIDSDVNDTRTENWYQWDVMWQGFIDNCGANMDFYGIHLYDWPTASNNSGVLRTGGHIEAALDMIEWYDNYTFGVKKDIVLSEYGSVSGWLNDVSPERRAWENLRPFNAMFMQFLERPSHIVLSMPFAPIKAEWGDIYDGNGNLIQRYPSTMMDKDANGDWQWTDFILFYELWQDVDGTRIDTKSNNLDIQVDAYANDNHLYLILNNLKFEEHTLDLNLFDDYTNNLQNVKMNHLYLEESLGTNGESVMDERIFTTCPGSVTIAGEATIILDYTFENPINIDQTSDEKKFMSNILEAGTTAIGGVKFRKSLSANNTLTTQVNNVVVPADEGEVTLRIAGRFWESHWQPGAITFNGNPLTLTTDWRGEVEDGRNVVFGVYEIDVPIEYLQVNNTITCTVLGNTAEYTTVMLQVYDFSVAPGRSEDIAPVAVSSISIEESSIDLMVSETSPLTATILPTDATNKTITWSSDNEAVATVDEFGIVTAVAVGSTSIIATSEDGSFTDTTTVNVIAFAPTLVSGISINEGIAFDVVYYITTPLHTTIDPLDATEQTIVWSSSNPEIVDVNPITGKVVGKAIFETATITATLTDPNNSNSVYVANIDITVNPPANYAVATGILVTPESRTLTAVGENFQVNASVLPANATINTYNWSSSNTDVAIVSETGLVTAVANGNTQIIATSTDGGFTDSCDLSVEINTTGNTLIIEAETFESTGGTFNDGFVPLGVNESALGINYVNSADWAEYTFTVPEGGGEYNIVYFISTPMDNAQIQIYIDGVLISTDNIPNNGEWDTYGPVTALNQVILTAGEHTLRIVASGSNAWQWNLDRIELQESVLGIDEHLSNINSTFIYPNPTKGELIINGKILNEHYDIKIFTLNGILVKETNIGGFPSNISIDKLQDGFYLLSISNKNAEKIFKIVKLSN